MQCGFIRHTWIFVKNLFCQKQFFVTKVQAKKMHGSKYENGIVTDFGAPTKENPFIELNSDKRPQTAKKGGFPPEQLHGMIGFIMKKTNISRKSRFRIFYSAIKGGTKCSKSCNSTCPFI